MSNYLCTTLYNYDNDAVFFSVQPFKFLKAILPSSKKILEQHESAQLINHKDTDLNRVSSYYYLFLFFVGEYSKFLG